MDGSPPSLANLGVPPERWRLKGEGAANWVLCLDRESARESSHLAVMVLRVRKPRPAPLPEQAAFEAAVWDPVLGDSTSAAEAGAVDGSSAAAASFAAMCREQRYVQRVMVRLLGQQHVPRAQPVAAPQGYLEKVLAANGLRGDGSSNAAAGVGAAALLPDVTLLPSCRSSGSSGLRGLASGGEGTAAAKGEGPMVCLELKPKCGFVGRCATVHPDNRHIKRSRSRYQLHQVLKLSQGKIDACSSYDPRDLFSGRPAGVRKALRALLAHPQNNLRLFVDGQPRRLAPEATSAIELWQAEQHEQHKPQALQQQAGQTTRQQQLEQAGQQHTEQQAGQTRQQQQQQEEQAGQQRRKQLAGKALWNDLDAALAGLLPLLPARQRRKALIELLAVALEAEGVLQRLLQAQSQCPYDIEGIYRLYCRLAGLIPGAKAGAKAAAAPAAAPGAATAEAAATDGSQGSSGGLGDAQQELLNVEAGEEGHRAALRRLLALPAAEAHAVLRSYVASATAKDCALMIALQRCQQPQQQQDLSGANGGASCWGDIPSGSNDSGSSSGGQMPCRAEAVQAQVGSEPGMLRLLPCGCRFRYRISFVDLDIKPLSKIPAHHALDQRIVAAARVHLQAQPGNCGAGSGEQGPQQTVCLNN